MFSVFFIAESLGQTVTELLTGEKKPLSNVEFIYWVQYYERKAAIEEKASKAKSDGKATKEFKRTMGPQNR